MTHEEEVKALQQQVRALKTMLRAVQWSGKGTGGGAGYCPTCKRSEVMGHVGCTLATMIDEKS